MFFRDDIASIASDFLPSCRWHEYTDRLQSRPLNLTVKFPNILIYPFTSPHILSTRILVFRLHVLHLCRCQCVDEIHWFKVALCYPWRLIRPAPNGAVESFAPPSWYEITHPSPKLDARTLGTDIRYQSLAAVYSGQSWQLLLEEPRRNTI